MAKYVGLSRSRPCDRLVEARGRLDKCYPGWTALKPCQPASFVFIYEDVTFFLSLSTNMVDSGFGDQFAMEVYHPHRFSNQLGFPPFIPESSSRSKDYQAWPDNVLSGGNISSSPRIPSKGKSLLIRNSLGLKRKASPVSVSDDRDPKHGRGVLVQGSGSTHAASHEISPRLPSDQPVEVSSSLSGRICTEIVNTSRDRRSYPSVRGLHSSCRMGLALMLQVRENILLVWLQRSWMRPQLTSNLGRVVLSRGGKQDLSCHGKKLKAIFSKDRRIMKVQGKTTSSKIRDKFFAARASTQEFSSKLLHEKEAVGKVRATLRQSQDRVAHLRQKLNELDTHIEALRDQVVSRESAIASLEVDKT
ncbi:hypothetical protein LIER_33123 [Lithospermum erythrorhizon]|uniref:Uncharacterized protein n=1 Tax=Lithospermum erythrorhizon TaxID=34254 RepID=A0AAV3RYY9_LITER